MSVNGGNQTVPTVVFPDGTALTNPSAAQVKARLAATARLGGRAGLVVRPVRSDEILTERAGCTSRER